MKFLCDNCKAKYQIPDEKIAGRTLKMKCRKCAHDIIIRGERPATGSGTGKEGTGRRPRPGSTARGTGSSVGPRPTSRRRGGSSVGPMPSRASSRPSALGADFRKQVAAGEEVPQRAAVELWHAAINDVPVGPIKREELARKIGTGAVTEDSLVWREGFDDWRPLKEVPELVALLRQRRVPAPPRSVPPRPDSSAGPLPKKPPEAPGAKPRSNVIPIGGRLGAAAAPAVEPEPAREASPLPAPPPAPPVAPAAVAGPAAAGFSAGPPSAPAPFGAGAGAAGSVSPSAPAFSSEPSSIREPTRRAIPLGAWIAIAGAIAFGLALAVMVAPSIIQSMGGKSEPVAQNDDPVAELPPDPVFRDMEPQIDLTDPEADLEEEEVVPEEETAAPTPSAMSTRTARPSTMSARPTTTTMTASMLAGGFDDEPVPEFSGLGSSRGQDASELEAGDIRKVVGDNQRQLQTCYERAVRGMPAPPSMRVDFRLSVNGAGRVTNARVSADSDVNGAVSCMRRAVSSWRFPRTGQGGLAQFPIVFRG